MKDIERDTSDVHWVNSAIPAPHNFRNASFKRGCVVYFGSTIAIATYSVVLYALSGAAFATLLAFYSLPSQNVTESVVGAWWSLSGFDCLPLHSETVVSSGLSFRIIIFILSLIM